ncbi:MAG: TetR/AcrR family transcriptional regulator [Deltaproteobacteria bacterium]|nr:TetR/AcrR family transcriptional regulator [Deltaproteobacteria bacterium]
MGRRCGRPAKDEIPMDSRKKIIEATISLIRKKGADCVTVRSVCESASLSIGTFYHYFRDKDDLMMFFLREISFEDCVLETDLSRIGDRLSELYMHLIDSYMKLGEGFMKSFYTTGNRSLSAYMSEQNGSFLDGTVMARSEKEMNDALSAGYIRQGVDVHLACMDICTIVEGCIFEWCLGDGRMDIKASASRIINSYLRPYLSMRCSPKIG